MVDNFCGLGRYFTALLSSFAYGNLKLGEQSKSIVKLNMFKVYCLFYVQICTGAV